MLVALVVVLVIDMFGPPATSLRHPHRKPPAASVTPVLGLAALLCRGLQPVTSVMVTTGCY